MVTKDEMTNTEQRHYGLQCNEAKPQIMGSVKSNYSSKPKGGFHMSPRCQRYLVSDHVYLCEQKTLLDRGSSGLRFLKDENRTR